MDPYSAEGELVNLHNAFHQAQYQQVLDFDTSSLSSSNTLPARILRLRAQIALHQYDAVISSLKSEKTPDLVAVRTFAEYRAVASAGKDTSKSVAAAQALAKSDADNLTVQLLAGSILASAGEVDDALTLLKRHQGSLDAVALIVQIQLMQNRVDLAAKEVQRARSWAQDSLLVNLAESWVGLRQGGERYQQAFYVYEELAQAPASQSVKSLVGQAVAELHLGRVPEAEAALGQARDLEGGDDADALANSVVLQAVLGGETEELVKMLERVDQRHQLLVDRQAKLELFDQVRARYQPKFEA